MTRPLILGSTSRYRRSLLARLQWPFEVHAPDVDETALPGEAPAALALRLAVAKARAVAALHPQAIVIGADQVANLDGRALGKPGHREGARTQLRALSGRTVVFETALAVVCAADGFEAAERVPVRVRFRPLADAEIEQYLDLEQPYDCAGSAKCEGLGIALVEAIESDDPTALVGLPLIATATLLRRAGLDPLAQRPLRERSPGATFSAGAEGA
jgi:septum formation protein